MLVKRLAALLSVGLLATLLMTAETGTQLAAQDKKDTTTPKKDDGKKPEVKKKDSPKDDMPDDEDILPKIKGTTVKIVKVDKEKKTFEGESKGKKTTYTVADEVKFIGPRGGKGDGFDDDRFVAGRKVKLVMDGTKIKEIHLDNRPAKKEKEKPKAKSKDE